MSITTYPILGFVCRNVHFRQDARLIAMDVQQPVLAGICGQRYFGEVHSAECRAVVAVSQEFARYLQADIVLRLLRAAPDVGSKNHVVTPAQRRNECIPVALRFLRENVDGSALKAAGIERIDQRFNVNHVAARCINETGSRFHFGERPVVDQVPGFRSFRDVQCNHVGSFEQRFKCGHGAGVAQRQLHLDIVVDHLHPQRFRQHADLSANVAVANDAQRLATGFARARSGLDPLTPMGGGVASRYAAHQ
jgi:hypothetical protein